MSAIVKGAMREELSVALAQINGVNGVRVLRWALRELPLDGGTAMAIAARLEALEPASH